MFIAKETGRPHPGGREAPGVADPALGMEQAMRLLAPGREALRPCGDGPAEVGRAGGGGAFPGPGSR